MGEVPVGMGDTKVHLDTVMMAPSVGEVPGWAGDTRAHLDTVTTAPSVGEVSLETRPCSAMTMADAAKTGSMARWGIAP